MFAWLIYELACLFLCVFFRLDWSYSAIAKKYDIPQFDCVRCLRRLRWLIIDIVGLFLCLFAGHDWHYFSMIRASGLQREFFRCCMRCEKSQQIDKDTFIDGKESDKW